MTGKKRIWIAILILAAVAFGLIGWIVWTNTNIVTSHFSITNDKIPDAFSGFRIAQVSDLHNHPWGEKLIRKLQKEMPDIIVVTGDLVDSSHTDFDIAMEFIEQAINIAPVYYVTGNHEAWLPNFEELEIRLEDAGVHMMDDTRIWIQKGNAAINLVGIMDPDFVEWDTFEGFEQSGVIRKLQFLLEEDGYNIVLCHRPELFEDYVKTGADLVITGHAHGGQVRIPFAGGLVAPNQGFFPKYTEGVYHQDATDMVVSRGLGNSIIPVRINNTPELVVITLNP